MHSLTFDSPSSLLLSLPLFLSRSFSYSSFFPYLALFLSFHSRVSTFLSFSHFAAAIVVPFFLSSVLCSSFPLSTCTFLLVSLVFASLFYSLMPLSLSFLPISLPPDLSTRSHFQTCSSHRGLSSTRAGRTRECSQIGSADERENELLARCMHLERISNRLLPQFVYDNYHNRCY